MAITKLNVNEIKMKQVSSQFIPHLKGQYIFTSENKTAPEGWQTHNYKEWKLFTSKLPVVDVYDHTNTWIGWCIGSPIVDGIFEPENIYLKKPENTYDPYSDFYDRAAGKWILLLVAAPTPAVYLDAYSSLPAVYGTKEKTLAATPTLIGTDEDWDEQLMAEIGYPQKVHWLPSGLTFKKNVRRLQANHTIHIETWQKSRHWPTPHTDLSINPDTDQAVVRVKNNIQNTISAVAQKYPLCLTLTGGMDSRVVLACARDHAKNAKIITFAKEKEETLDMLLASRLANQLKLDYTYLPIKKATEDELTRWQYVTGRSVAGGIWIIHKTLTQVDPTRVLMSGQSGEVHRGNYWRPGDTATSKISAEEILKRCKFPPHPVLVQATEEWLASLQQFNTFVMLDMVHIEQRMACWGAIQHFGNETSALEISPLGSRLVFTNMMRLPHKYRKLQRMPHDICKLAWPELLQLPFNEYPGIRGFFRSRYKKVKKMVKRMIN